MRQRVKTGEHSVLRQRSSQFQNHQVARCSSRAEKACGWDGGRPGLTV